MVGVDSEHEAIRREVLREFSREKHSNKDGSSVDSSGKPGFWSFFVLFFIFLLIIAWYFSYLEWPVRPRLDKVPSLDEASAGVSLVPRPNSSFINDFVVVNQNTKLVAARVVSSACSEPDDWCYARSLFFFVKNRVSYLNDPVGEYFETPEESLLSGAADCDGQSILLASLLRSVGILTRFDYGPNHVWVEAWLPKRSLFASDYEKEWVSLDPACEPCDVGEHG